MNNLRWLSDWPAVSVLLIALPVTLAAWTYYRRESMRLAAPYHWLLPTLKSSAILILLLTFLEPVWRSRVRQGEPGSVTFLIDASQSMTLADAPSSASASATDNRLSRFQRATRWLLNNTQFSLEEWAQEFDVRVQRIEAGSTALLWQSDAGQFSPLPESDQAWMPQSWSNSSGLGEALAQQQSLGASDSGSDQSRPKSVVVLLSDGQNNQGPLPIDVLRQMGNPPAVFTVGFGREQNPTDLAIQSINYPTQIYQSDVLRGQLAIADQLDAGTAFQASLLIEDRPVWTQDFVALHQGQRLIEFAVPVEAILAGNTTSLPAGAQLNQIPLQLTARLSTQVKELNTENNQRRMPLAIATQKSRLLIIDQYARWETRYLRNMFERDRAWQVTTLLADTTEGMAFPATREELLKFDLILLGDVAPDHLTSQQVQWLKEFVELSGGGLVIIGGSQRHLAQPAFAALHSCLPVEWLQGRAVDSARQQLPKRVELTPSGAKLSALRIDPRGEQESRQLWAGLPELHFIDAVAALPGTETLVNATDSRGSQPLMVTRRFGAGRVLFVASDETWRFRYKVADLVHQRLWQQLARWVMRTPMAVNAEFVSLDTGPIVHPIGEEVELRVQLRDASGRPASGRMPQASLRSTSGSPRQVPLRESDDLPGTYTARLTDLAAGEYQVSVEAAGFSRDALAVSASFLVSEPESMEMQEVSCNASLLEQLATAANGSYVHESDANTLIERIRPLSGGRFVESDLLLWQTYGWFLPVMFLLTLDWWLRKRAGLV